MHFMLIALVTGTTFAQTARPWWYTLERGKILFRDGAYGNALTTFEAARRERIAYFTRLEQDFITLLSNPYVRLMGDSLEFVERYISENNETRAAEALSSYTTASPGIRLRARWHRPSRRRTS